MNINLSKNKTLEIKFLNDFNKFTIMNGNVNDNIYWKIIKFANLYISYTDWSNNTIKYIILKSDKHYNGFSCRDKIQELQEYLEKCINARYTNEFKEFNSSYKLPFNVAIDTNTNCVHTYYITTTDKELKKHNMEDLGSNIKMIVDYDEITSNLDKFPKLKLINQVTFLN